MLNVLMTEIRLQGARVVSVVRELVAACVPQHVRMHLEAQLGLPTQPLDHAGKTSRAERRAAL